MDEETLQGLAKEVATQFVEEWKDTPVAQIVEVALDGSHCLVIKVDSIAPYVMLCVNLEEACLYAIKYFVENAKDEKERKLSEQHARFYSSSELAFMATSVPTLLSYCLVLLEIITGRNRMEALLGSISEGSTKGSVELAEEATRTFLQQHNLTRKVKPGAPSIIADEEVLKAIYRIGQKKPSRRRLAKELGTTPAVMRNWLRRKGFSSPEELISDLEKRKSEQGVEIKP